VKRKGRKGETEGAHSKEAHIWGKEGQLPGGLKTRGVGEKAVQKRREKGEKKRSGGGRGGGPKKRRGWNVNIGV